MEQISANVYGALCMYHHKECALFCPVCNKFLCPHCHDSHYSTGLILNAPQIKNVLEELTLKKNIKSITKSLQVLDNAYQQSITQLRLNFDIIYNGIKALCNISSPSKNFSNEAMSTLESMLKINEIKAEIQDQIEQRESKISNLYCHGKLFIDQIHNMISQIPTKIRQYNENQLKLAPVCMDPSPQSKSDHSEFSMKKLILRRTIDELPTKFTVIGPILQREPSMSLDQLLPLGNIIHYWKNSTVTLFNPNTKAKKNIILNKMINDRADSIAFNNRIFIIGGLVTDEVYEVDIVNKMLIPKCSMLCKKCHHSLCADSSSIYSIGGNNNTSLVDCEKYIVEGNAWSKLPDLITPRRLCATFIWEKYIYAFAGYGNTNLNSMERLMIDCGTKWEETAIKDTPSARCEVHGIPIKDGVLIVGGHCNSDYL